MDNRCYCDFLYGPTCRSSGGQPYIHMLTSSTWEWREPCFEPGKKVFEPKLDLCLPCGCSVTKSYVEPTSIECYREIATNKIFIMIWWNRVYYKSAFSWRKTLRSETSVIFDRSWQGKYLSWGEDQESVFFEASPRTHTPWGGADLWRCEYLVFGLVFRI